MAFHEEKQWSIDAADAGSLVLIVMISLDKKCSSNLTVFEEVQFVQRVTWWTKQNFCGTCSVGLCCHSNGGSGEEYTSIFSLKASYDLWVGGTLDISRDMTLVANTHSWVLVSNIFYFHPEPWGDDPIWRAYFSNGLIPPTSFWIFTPCLGETMKFDTCA